MLKLIERTLVVVFIWTAITFAIQVRKKPEMTDQELLCAWSDYIVLKFK